ncbi:MAG: caspase family protein [Cyanobacteriota bacterium]|nr:caspase family protein [Cyanobacteriota bacterium]
MSKIALLIGVSEYQPGLNPLPSAVRDVEAMRRVLVNPEMSGFTDSNVTVLKNPQPQDIRNAIYHLFVNRQKDDLLLFYFSGHGIKDEKGNLYFSTCDTRKDNGKLVTPSAVAARTLHDSINDSRSQRQVIILDCCFSGAIATGMTVKDDGSVNLEEHLGGKGRAILTSSTSTQYSFEQQDSELSIYTRYLVEGIDTGAADTDGDGQISIDELHEYAKSKVQEASPAMTPEFYPVKEGHKILLAKSPKDDPKLVYRQEVESRAQESQGNFSIFTLRILEGKRQELSISLEEANEIKEEVLKPYKEYERKLYEYEQALIEAVKKHYPFSETLQGEIKEYQQYLGLRDEDIAAIEKRVFAPKQVEYERQQEAERLKREQELAEYQEQLRQQDNKQQKQQQNEEAQILRQQEKQQKFKKQTLNSKSTWGTSKSTWLTIVAGFVLGALLVFILHWLLLVFGSTDELISEHIQILVFIGGALGAWYVSDKTLK